MRRTKKDTKKGREMYADEEMDQNYDLMDD